MRILGIELGGWSIKAIEMESRFRRFEILDLHEIRLPLDLSDPIAAYSNAIKELLDRLPNHPDKIVSSLPSTQVALRFLQIPLKQRKKVEQSYKFELEDSVPFKLEEAIVEHQIYPLKEGSLVFTAIAPKKNILSHLEWLKQVGPDPDWLTFEGMGLINIYLTSETAKNADPESGSVLLMDLGHLKTNIAIICQGRIELIRSLTWGGHAITQSILSSIGLTPEEAENKKIHSVRLDDIPESSDGETEELTEAVSNAFSPFLTDLSHSLVSYRNQFKSEISKILITGGTSQLKGIDIFLSKAIGVPVKHFHPFANMSFSREIDLKAEMRFSEPLGRAFVFNRKTGILFNFRKEELAKSSELTEVGGVLKSPLVLKLSGFIALLAIILFSGFFTLGYLANEEVSKVKEDLNKVLSDTFPSIPSKLKSSLAANPSDLKKFIDQKSSELEQRIKLANKSKVSMLSLLSSVSDAFPFDVKVDVTSVVIDDKSVKLEGMLYEGSLDKVLDIMKSKHALNNVSIERNGQKFILKGEVVVN